MDDPFDAPPGAVVDDPFDQPPPKLTGRAARQAAPRDPPSSMTWGDVGSMVLDAAVDSAKYLTGAPGTTHSAIGDIGAGIAGANRGMWGALYGALENTVEPVSRAILPENPLAPVKEFAGRMAGVADANAKRWSPPLPEEASNFSKGFHSGVQSLAQNAANIPALLVNPALGLGMMGTQTGGQAYMDATEKAPWLSPTQKLAFAGTQGGIEVATEMIPMLKFASNLKMGTGLGKTLLHLAAGELPGEQAATLMQDANEKLYVQPDKTWGEYLAERPDAALQTLVATAVGSLGMAGAGRAYHIGQERAIDAMAPDMPADAAADWAARKGDAGSALAAALGAQPVVDPSVLSTEGFPVQHGAIVAPRTFAGEPDASQQAPLPPGIAGLAPADEAGQPAPAVSPPGDQLGSYAGLAGAIGGIDPAGGNGAGTSLYGQQYVQPAYVDPEAALRGDAPDIGGLAGVLAGLEQPTGANEVGVEEQPEPPPPEQPWATREPEEGAYPTEAETAAGFDPFEQPPTPEHVAAAEQAPTVTEDPFDAPPLEPGTPEYVARLQEGFQPRVAQRDINAYKADIKRGANFGTDNPVLGMLESSPLNKAEAADYGADFGRIKGAKINRQGKKIAGTTGTGHQRYFAPGGMSIDQLAEQLWQNGYIRRNEMDDQNLVQSIVRQALNAGPKGAGPQPVYSHGYMEEQGRAQADAEHAANMLEDIDRIDNTMLENVHALAELDPAAFDPMIQALADNAGDEAKARQAVRSLYNQYLSDQQAAVATRQRPAGPGGIDSAGQEPARQGYETPGNQGSSDEGTGRAQGEEEGDYYAPDDWLMSRAEADEYKALRRIPYDQRTPDQQDRLDELDEDYSNYRRETLFSDPDETVNATQQPGEVKSQAEADAQLAEWKRIARAQRGNSDKVVLSLFDFTGEWSQPWYDAGYQVITLDIKNGQDLMELTSIEHIDELTGGGLVDVVLAAIPCTDFAASGARWWYEKDRDGVTKGSIELAQRALAVIEYLQPDVWAAENPVGRIQNLTRLPNPQLMFQPNDYGNPYTKKTLLYGKFNPDLPLNRVEPTEGSKMHQMSSTRQGDRSITPDGFAYAFFMANGGEGFGPVDQNVPHGEPTEETAPAAEGEAAPAAQAQEPAGAAAPAPAVGNEADTGVDGLQTYTPEELKAHDERVRRLERERIEREREAEAKAKADEEADDFVLTGSDRDADTAAARGQGPLFDGISQEQQSRMPPGAGFGKGFEAQAITQRPSRHTDAWTAMGLTPAQGANLPIEQAIKKLQYLYMRDFGLQVSVADNAKLVETRDSLLDGYRGISDMMYRLALPLNAVSLNETLKLHLLPFSKKTNYYGAYFPSDRRINMPGRSNSFGHEWMHALDHFITTLAARDGNEGLYSMIVAGEGTANPGSELQAAFAELMNRMFFDHADQSWKVLQLQVQAAATDKNGKPTKGAQDAQAKLDKMIGGQLKANKNVQPTDYAMSALGYQPGSDYWINPAEMLARAFEAYLANQRPPDMLNEFMGKTETAYLDDADKRLRETFPKQNDRSKIFNAFDDLFAALRKTQELGNGPTATMPEGEGVFDPSRWGKYPDNETRWQRTVDAQVNAFRQWRLPTMNGTLPAAKVRFGKANHFWHATFLANRSNLDLIAKKYNNAPPLRAINDMLYANRGSGRTQAQTLDEAIVTRSHSRNNELAQIMRLSGVKKLTTDENKLLRFMLVSGESMLGNQDVEDQLGKIDVTKISNERIDKLEKLATELRKYLDKEWYYNTRNGIDLAYTRNGYMPRVLNYAKVFDDLDGFEAAAAKTYGAQFDRQVGTDTDNLDIKEFARSLREVRHSASAQLIGMAKELRSLNAKIKAQERKLLTSDDPDIVQAKLAELYDERDQLLGDMLPILRDEWSKQAALQWRTHMATGELTEYDTMGPSVSYMRGRTLPPEADVLMSDYYNEDVPDAIATYTERSSRRVEYAKRFGVNSEKLGALLEEAAMKYKVHRNDIDQIKGIVNEATGRERHGIPDRVKDGLNSVGAWMTLYMLGRATIASMGESMTAGVRTRNMGDYVRGFGSIVQDIFNTEDAQARQALAECLGLIAEPYHDALMGNRLAGDSLTREQSLRAARYFEYTGLGALTRAQVRSTLPIATAYMRMLGRKAVDGHLPSRRELQELGIPIDKQKGFNDWLTREVATPVPSPADLMDRYNDEFHEYGQLYATATKRFSSQVIMEPTKMDKPKLATNPAARFIWGIQSFNMALWYNVTKPLVTQIFRDIDTVARGQSEARNAGRTRAEALANLGTAGIAIGGIFMGQFISTVIRAALLDHDKWKEKEKNGQLLEWLSELAAWRMGAAGLFDPLVQAVRGLKYQRDVSSLAAGAQFGAIFQNIQDVLNLFTANNAPGTNTAERKAAKAVWNTAIGPMITWATSAAPLGPLVGPVMGLVAAYVGSGTAQDQFANVVVGESNSPAAKKAAKAANGEVDPKAELAAERKRQRAQKKAALAATP